MKPNHCNKEATLNPSLLACIHDSGNIKALFRYRGKVMSIFQQWSEMGFVAIVKVLGAIDNPKDRFLN